MESRTRKYIIIYRKGGKKMTNYDRIKQMSVEEMAEYLSDHWSCIGCAFEKVCDDNLYRYINCHKNIKQWLEQEVEE